MDLISKSNVRTAERSKKQASSTRRRSKSIHIEEQKQKGKIINSKTFRERTPVKKNNPAPHTVVDVAGLCGLTCW